MDQKIIESGTDGGAALMPHPDVSASSGGIVAGVVMCLLSMSSVQFGAALSSSAIATYGPAGATWLRLAFAAIILAVIVRPKVTRYSREQWIGALVLGTMTAMMTLSFFSAIKRIPARPCRRHRFSRPSVGRDPWLRIEQAAPLAAGCRHRRASSRL